MFILRLVALFAIACPWLGPASAGAQQLGAKAADTRVQAAGPPRPSDSTSPSAAVPPAPERVSPAPGTASVSTPSRSGAGARDDREGNSYLSDGRGLGGRCALGPVCLGPVFNLGIANPLGFGMHARIGNYLGVGIDYQFLPEISIQSAATTASLLTVDGRVYPFGGAFFLSAGFAVQSVSAVASATVSDGQGNAYAFAARGAVHVPMVKFGLGFFGHKGFVLGIDLAVGVPLGDTAVELDASYSGLPPSALAQASLIEDQARAEAQAAVDKVLDMMPMLVQVNLLRVGYTF